MKKRNYIFFSIMILLIAITNENTHAPIVYSISVIKNSTHQTEAKLFLHNLQNEKSLKTFTKYGFKGID